MATKQLTIQSNNSNNNSNSNGSASNNGSGSCGKVLPHYQLINGKRFRAVLVPENYLSAVNYKARPEDVFVVGYYKSGTTWTQQIVHLLFNEGSPPANYNEFNQRTPYLELFGADTVTAMKVRGAIKTHFAFPLQPFNPAAKYIYIARNPKDVCVSFYHHTRNIPAYRFENGTFDDFFELFTKGETECGDWFDHVLSWFEHRNDPNILFLTYEGMKADERGTIRKIAKFLGDKYLNMLDTRPEVFEDVLRYSDIKHMKKQMNDTMSAMYAGSVDPMLEDADVAEGMKKFLKAVAQEAKEREQSIAAASAVEAATAALKAVGPASTRAEDLICPPNSKCSSSANSGASSPRTTMKKVEWIRKGVVNDWRNHFSKEQDDRLKELFLKRTEGSDLASLWSNVDWW